MSNHLLLKMSTRNRDDVCVVEFNEVLNEHTVRSEKFNYSSKVHTMDSEGNVYFEITPDNWELLKEYAKMGYAAIVDGRCEQFMCDLDGSYQELEETERRWRKKERHLVQQSIRKLNTSRRKQNLMKYSSLGTKVKSKSTVSTVSEEEQIMTNQTNNQTNQNVNQSTNNSEEGIMETKEITHENITTATFEIIAELGGVGGFEDFVREVTKSDTTDYGTVLAACGAIKTDPELWNEDLYNEMNRIITEYTKLGYVSKYPLVMVEFLKHMGTLRDNAPQGFEKPMVKTKTTTTETTPRTASNEAKLAEFEKRAQELEARERELKLKEAQLHQQQLVQAQQQQPESSTLETAIKWGAGALAVAAIGYAAFGWFDD